MGTTISKSPRSSALMASSTCRLAACSTRYAPGSQFLMSPRGRFRMSLDTRRGRAGWLSLALAGGLTATAGPVMVVAGPRCVGVSVWRFGLRPGHGAASASHGLLVYWHFAAKRVQQLHSATSQTATPTYQHTVHHSICTAHLSNKANKYCT